MNNGLKVQTNIQAGAKGGKTGSAGSVLDPGYYLNPSNGYEFCNYFDEKALDNYVKRFGAENMIPCTP